MKKKSIIIIIGGLIILAGILIGASVMYKNLSNKVGKDNIVEFATPGESTAADSPDAENSNKADISDEIEAATEPAKNFVLMDQDGQELMLSDFFDKPVVLNFWASWCPPCRAEMPDFEEMYEQYSDRINFVFVNMTDGSRETRETANAFVEEQGFSFPIYFDIYGEGADDYSIYYIPDTYFIDKHGNLSGYAVGGIDRKTMQEGIDKLLAD